MFSLFKPDRKTIDDFVDRSKSSQITYTDVGLTAETGSPAGYVVDHNRIVLGHGEDVWLKAKKAITNWKPFDFDWVELCWPDTRVEVGENVAILIKHFGFWSLNSARIIYVIDDESRFGFAYATLEDHGESGEERFTVERNTESGEVSYDLFAFSKPQHFLARIGYPITRNLQKQFAVDSKAAMLRAVRSSENIR